MAHRPLRRDLNQPTAKRVNWVLAALSLIAGGFMPLTTMSGSWPTACGTAVVALLVATWARGEPESCRCCGGPLPASQDGGIVVGCLYCAAENVLGLDMRSGEQRARATESSLAEALAQRSRARRVARITARVASVLLLLLLLWAR
jgi:hypothetical protein